jgi:hypothetical protein
MADDFDRTFDPSVDLGEYDASPRPGDGPVCGWCNTPLDDPDVRLCPHCGAALRPEGEEPAVPGVTVTPWDPRSALAAADALASAARAGLPDEALVGTGHPAFAPPDERVHLAMREAAYTPTAADRGRAGAPGGGPGLAAAAPREEEYVPPRRLPVPGEPFVPEVPVTGASVGPAGLTVHAGLTQPSSTDDGWWLTVLYARDERGLVDAEEIAPPVGPPGVPPLSVIGPVFSGALSGLIAEDGGRQQLRLALPAPDDVFHPWRRPLVVRLAVRWEPARAATMSQEQLATEVLSAFRRALEAAGRPA